MEVASLLLLLWCYVWFSGSFSLPLCDSDKDGVPMLSLSESCAALESKRQKKVFILGLFSSPRLYAGVLVIALLDMHSLC